MAGCKNCFNGCVDITPDKCVKYTGLAIPLLGIEEGETYTLLEIERIITDRLLSLMDGTSIRPDVNLDVCSLIRGYFTPSPYPPTLVDLTNAINLIICRLNDKVDSLKSAMDILEGDYEVDCIAVHTTEGTHLTLQAAIDKICELVLRVESIESSIENYVLISNVDSYIAAYLSGLGDSKMSSKMVPYAAVEYYGDPSGKFDVSGAGLTGTPWEKIYLCNGKNGTPDKRGRIAVGVTNGMGGDGFNPVVDPAVAGNPTYSLSTLQGSNKVTLSVSELPIHSHLATSTVNDPGHNHILNDSDKGGNHGHYDRNTVSSGANDPQYLGPSSNGAMNDSTTGITVSTSINNSGSGEAHSNIPPVLACYYIMYIP